VSKEGKLQPRSRVFNRFQTSVYGSWVNTAMDAHFDPLQESVERPRLTREQMEKVPSLRIPEETGAGHR
jgi:hypothetical protein